MKTAIVTGGGHGIGKSIVKRLLPDQIRVIALDMNARFLSVLKNETEGTAGQLITLICDVGDPVAVEKAMQQAATLCGKIDYLVNNAGISRFESIDTMPVETWNRIISVNLSSIFYMVKFAKHLFAEHSSIVNIASTRALMSEHDGEAYGASKGGVVALTHALAVSLGPKTRVNCISPGWIEVNNYNGLSEEDHSQHPVGKVGLPEDIADTVSFLLSDRATFITGQNIIVDGGMTRKMIYI